MSQSFVLPGPDLVRRRVLTPVALEPPKRLCTRLMISGRNSISSCRNGGFFFFFFFFNPAILLGG